MLLPVRTNIRPSRSPYTNYALIVINILIFLMTYRPHQVVVGNQVVEEPLRMWAEAFMLYPNQPYLWQFVSYAFLHGGLVHIIGNMFFLYLFGNNVNDKLGHIGYLCLYFAGAVFSGIGHSLIHSTPVLGASGAVAVVTGAYLVLFPQSLITVLYWFFFIGTMELPALYFIGLKMILLDNVISRTTPHVAYDAHLCGYVFGISAVMAMLAVGLVRSSGFDLWSMTKRWNQRRRYRDVVSSGYDPFTGRMASKQIKTKEVKRSPVEQARAEKIMQFRSEITNRINQGNLAAAAQRYLELMEVDGGQILPRRHLLDIANQLMADNRPTASAKAYEQFLSHYSNYEYIEQVQLMLGILYSRYLHRPQLAIKHLTAAGEKLTEAGQLKMCNDELRRLRGRSGGKG